MNPLKLNQYTPYTENISCTDLSCLVANNYDLKPFDTRTVGFLDRLSKLILGDSATNRRPEIAALGFWLRKAQLRKMMIEQEYLLNNPQFKVAPIGKVFHICPANVDTMFIYSMVVALLMGNRNVLRISKRMDAPHVLSLFDKLNQLLAIEEFTIFKNYINIISYDHNQDTSNFLSTAANARLIWGGDSTIKTFQSFTKAPRTKDIVFADRISMMVINSEFVLKASSYEMQEFIKNFYNDSYTFDQMGCSSPQTIYFIGSNADSRSAREKIFSSLEEYLKFEYDADVSSLASLKLNRMIDDALNDNLVSHMGNSLFKLIELSSTSDPSVLHGCGGGYFYFIDVSNINELFKLKVPKVQTLTYFGISSEDKLSLIDISYGEGIDRIVPVGNALNFYYIWDGYNLFEELSRKVYVE
jgi:hypothetical protein